MRLPRSHTGGIIRRLATLALVLWLAGFGCFLGCEMSAAAAPAADSQTSAAAESCSAFTHDCCHKSQSGPLASFVPTPAGQDMPACCPLTGQSADPARKAGNLNAPVAASQAGLPHARTVNATLTYFARSPQIPDRGSTYLHCCVFLI